MSRAARSSATLRPQRPAPSTSWKPKARTLARVPGRSLGRYSRRLQSWRPTGPLSAVLISALGPPGRERKGGGGAEPGGHGTQEVATGRHAVTSLQKGGIRRATEGPPPILPQPGLRSPGRRAFGSSWENPPALAFPETHRSVVLAVRSADPEERARALDDVVRAYWRPVFMATCGGSGGPTRPGPRTWPRGSSPWPSRRNGSRASIPRRAASAPSCSPASTPTRPTICARRAARSAEETWPWCPSRAKAEDGERARGGGGRPAGPRGRLPPRVDAQPLRPGGGRAAGALPGDEQGGRLHPLRALRPAGSRRSRSPELRAARPGAGPARHPGHEPPALGAARVPRRRARDPAGDHGQRGRVPRGGARRSWASDPP